jgi:hypothetical protein
MLEPINFVIFLGIPYARTRVRFKFLVSRVGVLAALELFDVIFGTPQISWALHSSEEFPFGSIQGLYRAARASQLPLRAPPPSASPSTTSCSAPPISSHEF